MTALLDVIAPAADRKLTTAARARAALNLAASTYDDATIDGLIDSASAAVVSYLNIAGDGAAEPTLARETIDQSFSDFCGGALILARAPIADIRSVQENGGAIVASRQSGADGAVDVGVDASSFISALGPDGLGFSAAHVGREITIAGAGAAGADHATTIAAFVDAQTVTLAAAALTTVAGASFTVGNPAFNYEWRRLSGLVWKIAPGGRVAWAARQVRIIYDAGYVLPGAAAGRNLPLVIEDACILLIKRRLEVLRDCDNPRIKSESWAGIGSWTFEMQPIEWKAGVPSDVAAMLNPYKRRVV